MENLNNKVWYRFLKVVFIISFIVVNLSALPFAFHQKYVYRCNNGKIIPYSSSSNIDDLYRVDKECDPNVIVPTFDEYGNYTEEYMRYYIGNYHGTYVIDYLNSLWFTPLVFLSIWLFFWLVSRLFFYIFIKEKFLTGKMASVVKGVFTKR